VLEGSMGGLGGVPFVRHAPFVDAELRKWV
jgi:hypothetical protein